MKGSRPGWVWAIFLYYVFTTALALLSRALIYLRIYPIQEVQDLVLRSQATGTVLFGLGLRLLYTLAATWLWLLRRHAFVASVVGQVFKGGPLATLFTKSSFVIVVAGASRLPFVCTPGNSGNAGRYGREAAS